MQFQVAGMPCNFAECCGVLWSHEVRCGVAVSCGVVWCHVLGPRVMWCGVVWCDVLCCGLL